MRLNAISKTPGSSGRGSALGASADLPRSLSSGGAAFFLRVGALVVRKGSNRTFKMASWNTGR